MNKLNAWVDWEEDLHWLTQDEDKEVRRNAIGALGSAFSDIPDKNEVRL
jgi:HEAT repeat protein